jgi:hypothetical protein
MYIIRKIHKYIWSRGGQLSRLPPCLTPPHGKHWKSLKALAFELECSWYDVIVGGSTPQVFFEKGLWILTANTYQNTHFTAKSIPIYCTAKALPNLPKHYQNPHYTVKTPLLHCTNKTLPKHPCYTAKTPPFHFQNTTFYTAKTPPCHSSNTPITLTKHPYYTAITQSKHYQNTPYPNTPLLPLLLSKNLLQCQNTYHTAVTVPKHF